MNPFFFISPPTPFHTEPSSSPKEEEGSFQESVKDTSASCFTPTHEMPRYLERLSQIPDVREARIASIQTALAFNSYVISPEQLGEKLLQELSTQTREIPPSTAL